MVSLRERKHLLDEKHGDYLMVWVDFRSSPVRELRKIWYDFGVEEAS